MAGLLAAGAMVWVGPPLSCSGPSNGATPKMVPPWSTTVAPPLFWIRQNELKNVLEPLNCECKSGSVSAELSDHLGYEFGEQPPEGEPNRRNGWTSKTLITDQGPVPVELPRDREGSFEPQLVPKHQRRFAGFDDKIVSMYARGMSTREISKHLEEIYGVEVGRDTISRVTDAVLDDVKEWQARPLEKLYLASGGIAGAGTLGEPVEEVRVS